LLIFSGDKVTIVTTHIENRTTPKGRVRQADELLEMIRPIRDLLIVGRGYEYDGGGWLSHQHKVDCTEKAERSCILGHKRNQVASRVEFAMDIPKFWSQKYEVSRSPTGPESLYWRPIRMRSKQLT
jgi:hypothetical protein